MKTVKFVFSLEDDDVKEDNQDNEYRPEVQDDSCPEEQHHSWSPPSLHTEVQGPRQDGRDLVVLEEDQVELSPPVREVCQTPLDQTDEVEGDQSQVPRDQALLAHRLGEGQVVIGKTGG